MEAPLRRKILDTKAAARIFARLDGNQTIATPDPGATRLLNAGRMGSARSDVAGLAAQPGRLARQAGHHSLGLRRNGKENLRRGESSPAGRQRGQREIGQALSVESRMQSAERRVRQTRDQPRLDAGQRSNFRPQPKTEGG